MAEEKSSGGGDGLKNIIVILTIWGVLVFILFGNSTIRNYIFDIFPFFKTTPKADISKSSVFIYNGNNFASANFYGGEKTGIFDIAQSSVNSNIFYAATDSGIFMSNDGAQNWYRLNLPKEFESMQISRIFINYLRPYEISFLVFQKDRAILYITRDNFFSVDKLFEINRDTIKGFANDKTANIVKPAFNGNILIGTGKD